ncbi:MAG: hypothetical protein Q7S49_00205 [bacterium]|nr:hypothetical protein [bacterium]
MTNTNKAIWVLRIGVAGEFLGHGVLALQGKADWIGWFAKFGVSDPGTAAILLTLVGALDVLVALIVLFRPIRPIVLWAVFWGFWTALVRPIVGQPIWDFVERFANWGAPLALFFLLKNGKSE